MRGMTDRDHEGTGALHARRVRGDLGSAMLVVLAAAAILSVTVAAVIGIVVFQQTQLAHAQGVTRASQLAQEGMEYYLAALKLDPRYWETTSTITGEGEDGTWTVGADAVAQSITAVGHDRVTGVLHVITAKVRAELFSDYTIVSGESLTLGNSVNPSQLSVTGQVRGNNGIKLDQPFPGLHIATDASVGTSTSAGMVDFSKAEAQLPHMFTAASYREAWNGDSSVASPLAFYRDPNDYTRNYWGDVNNLAADARANDLNLEPERVGVGVDFSNGSDASQGLFYIRAIFPPAISAGSGTAPTHKQLVDFARQDPTWNLSGKDDRPPQIPNSITPKYLNPNGNNVVYVGGEYDAYVKGEFSRSVTIVSENDIYIMGPITRAAGTTATVGLVAKGNIYICGAMPSEPADAIYNTNDGTTNSYSGRVYRRGYWNALTKIKGEILPASGEIKIQAALMAINGGIYMDPASVGASATAGPAKRGATLKIQGSLATNRGMGGPNFVNVVNDTVGGFSRIEISHDDALDLNPPPLYPQIGSGGIKVVSWDEYTTATEPVFSVTPIPVGTVRPPTNVGGTWVFDPSGDKLAPLTTANVLAEYPGEAIITLTPVDSDAGVWRTYYTVNTLGTDGVWTRGEPVVGTTIDIAAPGANQVVTHSIDYWSVDNAGNSEIIQTSAAFRVVGEDTIPPVTTVIDETLGDELYGSVIPTGYPLSGEPETVWGDFIAHFTSVDTSTGLGADRIWYRVLHGDTVVKEELLTTADQRVTLSPWVYGPRYLLFEYYGIDQAGNREVTKSFRIYQHAPDLIAPSTMMTTSRNAGGAVVYLTATDDPSGRGVKDIVYKIDGGAWITSGSNPTTIAVPAPATGSQQHTITYYAHDVDLNAGAPQSATFVAVKVPLNHTTPPVTTSDIVPVYIGPAHITLNPSDEIGVENVYWKLSGGAQQTGTSVTAPAPLSGSIAYTLEFWAVDFAGNTETPHNTASFTVLPEQTPPVTVAHNLDLYNTAAVVELTAKDEDGGSGVKSTFYRIDGGAYVEAPVLVGPTRVTVSGDGTHTVTFYSVDNAGNAETPKSTTLKIDMTAPTTSDDHLATYTGQALVHLTASDPGGSGVVSTIWKTQDGRLQTFKPVILGPGSWDVTYWSVDKAGNTEPPKSFHCEVAEGPDTEAPRSYDEIAAYYRTSPALIDLYSWDVQTGVRTMYYRLDGGATVALPGTFNPPWGYQISVGGADATHTIEYWASDKANGVSAGPGDNVETPHHTATFTIDTAMPTTTIRDGAGVEVTSGVSPAYWSNVTFKLTSTDLVSGVSATYYALDGGAAQLGTTVYVPASTTNGAVPHTIEYWSVDKAGNTEARRSVQITSEPYDVVAPTTVSDMKRAYTGPVDIHLTASDNYGGSGVAHTYYQLDGGAQVEGTMVGVSGVGTHVLEFWSVDLAGNIEGHQRQTCSIDVTGPTTTSNAVAWYAGSASISLTATDNAGGSGVAYTFYRLDGGVTGTGTTSPTLVTAGTEGTHSLEFWSVDFAGNAEAPHKTASFGIDNTPPVTTSDVQATYTMGDAVITLTPTDVGGSGVKSTYYTVDGGALQWGTKVTVAPPYSGTPVPHTVVFWSVDNVGKVEAQKTISFTVAATANMVFSGMTPGVLATIGVRNTTVSVIAKADRNITAGSATLDGVAQTISMTFGGGYWVYQGYYATDGCDTWWVDTSYYVPVDYTQATGAFSTSGLANGWHTVTFTFTASSGLNSVKTWTFNVAAAPDVTPPVTTSNATAYYRGPATVTLTASDEVGGMGLDKTYYRLDDGAQVTGTAPVTTVSVSSAGSHKIEYWSTDKANNSETHKFSTFIIDTVAPTTSSDATTTPYKGNATVRLTATDNTGGSGVKATYYKVDSGVQQTGTTVVVTAPSFGAAVSHTITFWSIDNAGNTENATTATISVKPLDDTPPTTTSDATATYAFKSTITLTAKDNTGGSGVAATYYKVDNGAQQTGTAASTGGMGSHRIEFWSVDVAGNVETHNFADYVVLNDDSIAPTTTADVQSTYVANATIHLTAIDNPGGSGVKATYYMLDTGAQLTGTTVSVTGPVAGSAAHTLYYWSVDNVGNIEAQHAATFTIDAAEAPMTFTEMTPPEFSIVTASRNFTVSVVGKSLSANITAISAKYDGAAKIPVTIAYATSLVPSGYYIYGYWQDDGCGGVYWVEDPTRNPANAVWVNTTTTVTDYTKATGSFALTNAADGTHTVSFTYTVAGGQQATKTWTFVVQGPDNQPPVTTANVQASYTGTATISLTATDYPQPGGSGVAATYYTVDGGPRQTGTTIIVAPPQFGSASHTITYWSVDNLANTETAHSATFVINAPPDTIAPTTTSDATSTYTGTATINLTAYDNAGGWGVKGTYYKLDSAAQVTGTKIVIAPPSWGVATHTIEYWSDDRANNVEVHTIKTFVVNAWPDTTPPLTTSNAQAIYAAASTITLTATDNTGGWGVATTYYRINGGTLQTGTSIPTGGSGSYLLEFWSVDRANNEELPHKTASYIVDTLAPTTTSDAQSTYTGTATITLTATDTPTGSGIKSTNFRVDTGANQVGTVITIAPPASGSVSHTIYFWSVDKANNTETLKSATFTVNAPADTTPPTTTSNAQSVYAKPGTITLSASDNAGGWGVANTYYKLDSGAQQTGTSVGTGGAGTHRLEFWSTDKASNEEPHHFADYSVTADTTAPITTSNAVAYYIGSATIVLNATDTGGWGVKATYYTVDGGVQQTGTSVTVAGPLNGSAAHRVTFWSVDNADNIEVAQYADFTISGIPPTMTWTGMTPAAGTTLLTSFATVSVTGDAAENVVGVTAKLDGISQAVSWSTPPGYWVYQGYWDTSGCTAVWIDTSYWVPGDATLATSTFTATGMADGSHTVTFDYTLASGKIGSKSWTFSVSTDVTAPSTSSDAKTLYNGAATIKLTAADNTGGSGIKATYYKVDGGAQQTGTTISVAAPASGSATHTISFWSVDNANNSETPKSATFVVWKADTTAPTTTSTAQAVYNAPSTITLIATDNSGGSGVAHTYYKLDGGAQTEGTLLGTGGEGRHDLEMWSVDNLGNVETPHKTVSYVVDMTAPTTTSDAKPEYTGSATEYTGIATISLMPTDTPAGSGIASTFYTVDGGAQTQGTSIIINGPTSGFASHSITFWSVDNAGNTEAAKSATFTVAAKPDVTPPTTTSNALTSYAVPGVIQLFATDNVGGWGVAHTYYRFDGGSQVESMTVATGGVGSHTLEFWSTDKAGNIETPHQVTYTVTAADVTPPLTTTNAKSSYIGPATITLTATDDSGLMPFTYYRVDGGADQWGTTVVVAAPVAGIVSHTVTYWSVDNAGNTETAKSVTFTVAALPADMQPSGFTPAEGATITQRNPNISLTAQATKTISGAVGSIDGTVKTTSLTYPTWGDFTKATATFATAGLANGVHTASVTFTDSTGADYTRSWTFTVNAPPDTTAPVTTQETIIAGGTGQVRLTATDEGGMGVASTYYRLDGGLQFSGTPPVTTIAVGAGSHTIEFWSVDLASNAETHHTVSFVIDVTPPSTTSNARPSYTGTAVITLTPSDNAGGSGLKATYYIVDTGATQTGTSVSVAPPASADPATHTVYFWSVDNAGNVETTKSATFQVWAPIDGIPPTTTSDARSSYIGPGVITLTATDNVGGWGVDRTYWVLDGGVQQTGTTVGTGGTGAHTLEFWSVDVAGNLESPHVTVSYVVTADTAAPVTASDVATSYTGPATITFTATDNSGVTPTTYWRLDGGAQTTGRVINVAAPSSGSVSHTIQYWSVDGSGNAESPIVKDFIVAAPVTVTSVAAVRVAPDTQAPITSSNAAAEYTGIAAIVQLTATDGAGGSGVAHTYYRVDGGAQEEGTLAGVSGIGTHTLEFWSVDVAGNVETPHQIVSFTIAPAPDTIAPKTVSDAVASYAGSAVITLTPSDEAAGSGVKSTYYRIDGGPATIGTSIVIAPPATGSVSHTIQFWSVDNAGNTEPPTSQTFTVGSVPDATAPVTAADVVASYAGTATITLTPSDNVGGSGVRASYYRIDDGPQTEGVTIAVAPPATGSAQHTIEYWSVDFAGNVESPHRTATFSVTPQTLALLQFRWSPLGQGEASLHVQNAAGVTIASTQLSGTGSQLYWDVPVPAGQTYYLVCDSYVDSYNRDSGGGYGVWSGTLATGQTYIWNY